MKILVILAAVLGVASAHAKTYTKDDVYKIFAEQFKGQCDLDRSKDMDMNGAVDFKAEQSSYQLFTFVCNVAAYNVTAVHYLNFVANDSAPQVVSLAAPTYEVRNGKLVVTGIQADQIVPYGALNAKTLTLDAFFKGRGVGDAFTSGTYKFENSTFVLKKYDVDATYDGKINPVTVFDYK